MASNGLLCEEDDDFLSEDEEAPHLIKPSLPDTPLSLSPSFASDIADYDLVDIDMDTDLYTAEFAWLTPPPSVEAPVALPDLFMPSFFPLPAALVACSQLQSILGRKPDAHLIKQDLALGSYVQLAPNLFRPARLPYSRLRLQDLVSHWHVHASPVISIDTANRKWYVLVSLAPTGPAVVFSMAVPDDRPLFVIVY
jgi:hypothetical protein